LISKKKANVVESSQHWDRETEIERTRMGKRWEGTISGSEIVIRPAQMANIEQASTGCAINSAFANRPT
jgi:hypothetical protein